VSISVDRAGNQSPQSELTRVGWLADAELTYEDWLRQGSKLGLAGRNAAWWIGDWLRYGTARYGSKYAAAARTTGYDRQTLMNMVYVATRFEFSRRRENLSWSHHAELAAFDPDKQERWLDRATAERFSVRDLREMLLSTKQSAGRTSTRRAAAANIAPDSNSLKAVPARTPSETPDRVSHAAAETDRQVACPHCGHHFTLSGHQL